MLSADVLIVGGGIAGLSAAKSVQIARPNAKVLLLERRQVHQQRGGAMSIPPNGIHALEAVDCALKERVLQLSSPHPQLREYTVNGELIESRNAAGAPLGNPAAETAALLAWSELTSTLVDALPPSALMQQHRFLRYEQHDSCVVSEFVGPQGQLVRLESEVLIGCDGGRSDVRQQLLGDAPMYMGTVVWRGISQRPVDWPVRAGIARWRDPSSKTLVLTATLPGNRLSWEVTAPWPAEQLDQLGAAHTSPRPARPSGLLGSTEQEDTVSSWALAAILQLAGGSGRQLHAMQAVDRFPKIVQDVIAKTAAGTITQHAQHYRDPSACTVWGEGRVSLAGDAAHLATPVLGQAAAQALEDAVELGRAIGEMGPCPQALRQYECVRQPQASAVQAASVKLHQHSMAGIKTTGRDEELSTELGFVQRAHAPLRTAETAHARA